MEYDVTIDRDKYIGGSDLAAIMGISPFKTRWQLLLEKAGLAESDFSGNRFTEYGNEMEGAIRDYINQLYFTNFEPNRVIEGDFRAHTDGFNGESVLEIKTTSNIHDDVSDYKIYLVQLIKYMELNNVSKGILAVYNRPADFNPVFDPGRLQILEIDMSEYISLLEEVNEEIDRFRADLERLKNNPLLSEQDFIETSIVELSQKAVDFERQLIAFKELEEEYKKTKEMLFGAMHEHGLKTWNMINGTKITMVDPTDVTTVTAEEFDIDSFKEDMPETYAKYLKPVSKTTSKRSGYIKITIPKEVKARWEEKHIISLT